LKELAQHYLSLPLLPLFFLAAVLGVSGRIGRSRPPVLKSIGGIAALLVIPWIHPHYYAPFSAALIVSVVLSLRFLRAVKYSGGRPFRIVAAAAFCILGARVAVNLTHDVFLPPDPSVIDWAAERDRVGRQLKSSPGQHLVIVRYSPDHDWAREWVYNSADIDASPVVWARDMDADGNSDLLEYFKGRRAWLLQPDANPPGITPYAVPALNAPAR
jgi:hypothetical protein